MPDQHLQQTTGLCLFPTSLGDCGIAWRGRSIIATQLPEATPAQTANRLESRTSVRRAEPSPAVRRAIGLITQLLAGARTDLRTIECDLGELPPFALKVYAVTREIPAGQTLTYGDIAQRLGDKQRAQSVGRVLGRNPLPIIVPCHRVIGVKQKLTGFSAHGGVATKLKMLSIEGALLGGTPDLFSGPNQ